MNDQAADNVHPTGSPTPPDVLAKYEAVLPGLAMRIVDRADAEMKFRHRSSELRLDTERKALDYSARRTFIGQVIGFVFGLIAIPGGIWLIHEGKGTAGLTALIASLASVAAVFIVGNYTESHALLPPKTTTDFKPP